MQVKNLYLDPRIRSSLTNKTSMPTFTKALGCGLTQIPNTNQISEVLEVVQRR